MLKKILFPILSLLGVGTLCLVAPNMNQVNAENYAVDWKITYTAADKYTKIRADTSDTNGVAFEGITCPSGDRYSTTANISYYKPVTIAMNYTIKLDGLRFKFAIRNASNGTGQSGTEYDFGDYAGFFFATTARPFSSRNTGSGIKNVMFTLFCKPYPAANQSRFCINVGERADVAGQYYNYACMDAKAVQYSQPNTSSAHNWSSADSIVFDTNSYVISGNTYYNAGLTFAIDSYDATWYKLTIGQYDKINNTLWSANANYNSTNKTATFYLQKSYLEEFINNGNTVLHVYGSGSTTFAYIYDVYNESTEIANELNFFTPYLYMGENNTNQCLKYFTSAREKFLSLSSGAKQTFKTSSTYSSYRARYEAWGRALGQDPYSAAQASNSFMLFEDCDSSVIITISLTALVCAGFILVAAKKKKSLKK